MDKTSLALEMMTAVKDKLNVKKLKKKSLSLSEEIKYPRKKEQLPVKVKVVKMRTLLSLTLLQVPVLVKMLSLYLLLLKPLLPPLLKALVVEVLVKVLEELPSLDNPKLVLLFLPSSPLT